MIAKIQQSIDAADTAYGRSLHPRILFVIERYNGSSVIIVRYYEEAKVKSHCP